MMKRPKKIIYTSLLGVVFSLFSCTDSDKALPYTENFFKKVIANKHGEAAKMIDPKSKLYTDRFQFVKDLKKDKLLGTLNSTGGGFYSGSKTTISTFGFTSVTFPIKLNYDSTHRTVTVQVIDKGQGFKINKIDR